MNHGDQWSKQALRFQWLSAFACWREMPAFTLWLCCHKVFIIMMVLIYDSWQWSKIRYDSLACGCQAPRDCEGSGFQLSGSDIWGSWMINLFRAEINWSFFSSPPGDVSMNTTSLATAKRHMWHAAYMPHTAYRIPPHTAYRRIPTNCIDWAVLICKSIYCDWRPPTHEL